MGFADLTLEEVAARLAAQAEKAASCPKSWAEKQAEGMSDYLSGLGQTLQSHPELRHALMGGAVGAGLGGLGTAWGNRGKDPGERRSVVGSALTGGLAGAAVGGGASLLHKGIAGMQQPQDPRIDAAAKIKELQAPPNPLDAAFRGVTGNLWNTATKAVPGLNPALHRLGLTYGDGDTWVDKNLPVSGTVLPELGLGDLLAHTIPNAGYRFGVGRMSPEHATGGGGGSQSYFDRGVQEMAADKGVGSRLSETMREALKKNPRNYGTIAKDVTAIVPSSPDRRVMTGPHAGENQSIGSILGQGIARPTDPNRSRLGNLWQDVIHGANRDTARPVMTVQHTGYTGIDGPNATTETLSAGNHGAINSLGYEAANAAGKDKAVPGLRNLLGMQYRSPGWKTRAIGRVGAYGAIPLAEYVIRNQMSDAAKNTEVSRLVAPYQQGGQGQ